MTEKERLILSGENLYCSLQINYRVLIRVDGTWYREWQGYMYDWAKTINHERYLDTYEVKPLSTTKLAEVVVSQLEGRIHYDD